MHFRSIGQVWTPSNTHDEEKWALRDRIVHNGSRAAVRAMAKERLSNAEFRH